MSNICHLRLQHLSARSYVMTQALEPKEPASDQECLGFEVWPLRCELCRRVLELDVF